MFNLKKTFDGSKENKNLLKNLILSKMVREKWSDVVGGFLEQKLTFQYIMDDYCEIQVESATWLTEIKFYEKQILEKLNKLLKYQRKIKRIKLVMSQKGIEKKKTTYANKKNYDNMIGR
tara:strand:+ start:1548 stop:1904 length:357 start_codon:yes stop_codon:yes gene_type:complete